MLLGLVLAVERPAMQAILFQLVGPELLPGAVAANSTINSVSRLIGPAVAGALIATVGVETCFVINAASYLVVIGALVTLRTSELVDRPLAGRAKGKLLPTTFPSMVRFGFHRGAGSVGMAMSISAVGSILGGIYVAGIKPHPRHRSSPASVANGGRASPSSRV